MQGVWGGCLVSDSSVPQGLVASHTAAPTGVYYPSAGVESGVAEVV